MERAQRRPRLDVDQWPLVGREDEFQAALGAVAVDGSVALTGAAGVGKTRLAREVASHRASESGLRIVSVSATRSAATIPLGAVAHLVPAGAIDGGRDATLQRIVAALHPDGDAPALLLTIDDAHLLDDASAALIHLLITTGVASGIVTFRSGERVPDAIAALWKDGRTPLIALQELSRVEVDELIARALGGTVDGAAAEFLWTTSRGNALFLRELIRHGIETGDLHDEHGLWRWTGRFEPGERLQDLVARRMGGLSEDEQRALELIAVGEPLTRGWLDALGVAEVAERLERRGLVTVRSGMLDEVRLGHPLFGEVTRAQIPRTRLDHILRRLADTATAPNGEISAADMFRCAVWRADAGDTSHPAELRAAARHAWSLWAAPLAEQLARAALNSGPEFEAGYLLGEALSDQGRTDEALEAWSAVDGLPGPDHIHASLAMSRSGLLAYELGRPDVARRVLLEAADRLTDDTARRLVLGALAVIDSAPPPTSAGDDDAELVPTAALAAILNHATRGEFDLAVAIADQCLARVDEWSESIPTIVVLVQVARPLALGLSGSLISASAIAQEQYETAVRERSDYPRACNGFIVGVLALLRGEATHAIAALREITALMQGFDRGLLRPAEAYLAMALALEGNSRAAHEHLAIADASNPSLDQMFGVEIARARAWTQVASGQISAANESLRAAADDAMAREHFAFEALSRHDLARFGRAAEATDRLTELASVVDGVTVGLFARHADALARDDGAGLDAVAVEFTARAMFLFGSEASCAAAGAHRRHGRRASALASRDLARSSLDRCGAVATPLLALLHQPDDLTAREREVASLAASGLSSRDIAAQLGITARTVDNLLGRTYTKLGIAGRRDLSNWLTPTHPRE